MVIEQDFERELGADQEEGERVPGEGEPPQLPGGLEERGVLEVALAALPGVARGRPLGRRARRSERARRRARAREPAGAARGCGGRLRAGRGRRNRVRRRVPMAAGVGAVLT